MKTVEQMVQELLDQGLSLEQAARELNWVYRPTDDQIEVPGWIVDTGNDVRCPVAVWLPDIEDPEEAAAKIVESNVQPSNRYWVLHVTCSKKLLFQRYGRLEHCYERRCFRFDIEPEEPSCRDKEGHAWDQTVQVWSEPYIGSEEITYWIDRCRKCGCERTYDEYHRRIVEYTEAQYETE